MELLKAILQGCTADARFRPDPVRLEDQYRQMEAASRDPVEPQEES
jgi:hypothetical protein